MKQALLFSLVTLTLTLTAPLSDAQPVGPMGGPPRGPKFSGAMNKLFGDNSAFSAKIEMNIQEAGRDEKMTIPGTLAFHDGKSRFEMDVAETKGARIPPQAAAQMKAMGFGEIAVIALPDKKLSYMIYTGMESYVESALSDDEAAGPEARFKMDSTELGKETVDGHPCTKNKATITSDKGVKHESTVWNASDLKNFPIKIQYIEDGKNAILSFTEVKFDKPDAAKFVVPAKFTKYGSMGELMRGVMMKQFRGGK